MRPVLLAAATFAVTAATTAAADDDYRFPRARIPHVGDAAPTVDGRIGADEVRRFAAIGGMVTWGGASGNLRTVVPRIQQVTWYLGYDDERLYIFMRSPNPPGSWPLARVKADDFGNRILWDDHVEIQLARDRDKATFPGVGFYKIMANAKGAVNDDWYYNGTPGTETEWSLAGPVKCHVTRDAWELELAVDLRALDVRDLDGQTWVLQLLRADAPGGHYFAGWVGEAWMAWKKFGQVTFDPHAPAFRLLETGELPRGKMDLGVEIVGGPQKVPVTVAVTVTDGEGRRVYRHSETHSPAAGRTAAMRFAKELPLTDRDNEIDILATFPRDDGEGGKETVTLYHARAPIIKLTPAYHERHVAPWLEQRPKGDFAWDFACWPSYDVARTKVDVDFFGIDEKLADATAFEVAVTRRDGRKPLAAVRGSLEGKTGEAVLKGLDLPVGKYRATVRLFAGKDVVGRRSMDFVRRTYPWEGNRLGVSDRVLPPFTPIEADADKAEFDVWGRTVRFGETGLPERIVADGGAGRRNILAAPIRLAAAAGGKGLAVTDAALRIERSSPGRVDMTSTGRLGPAACELATRLDYDGWTHVRLTLDPGEEPASLDRLALRVPLWSGADTMYVQRAGDGYAGNAFGDVPDGKGRVWHSGELLPFGQWRSFVPVVFVGNGDKGLWWFAADRRGWTFSRDRPAVEIHRGDAGVELRVNILAARAELTEPRTWEFAFLADPVKHIPDERRWAWGRRTYHHDTPGYRYYGRSVDGYQCTDEDLAELKRVLTDPTWSYDREKVKDNWVRRHLDAFRGRGYRSVAGHNRMCVLYGSTSLTGLGLDAFDTYGGEWLGRTNWEPNPQTEFEGRWNLQFTKRWTTPRELTTVGVNFTPSYEECFVWHHHRLLKAVPVNGTWWDNRSLTVISDYDPQAGEFYERFNVFTRRRLMKRLANIGWSLNRRPWWINNMHVDWSFCQVAWHVENEFYTDNEDTTMVDQLPVDVFRAMCRIKRGIVHRLATRGPEGTVEQVRRAGRNAVGMCLLHDIGSYGWGADRDFSPDMLDLLDRQVGFFDGAEFIGYWRNRHVLIETPGVYASLYRNRERTRAVAVVLSSRRGDVDVRFRLRDGLLKNREVTRITDGETGRAFGLHYDRKTRRRRLGELKIDRFGMPDRGVRLLILE